MLKQKLDRDTLEGYVTPSSIGNHYFFRMVICNHNTTVKHIDEFWNYLNKCADELIQELSTQ